MNGKALMSNVNLVEMEASDMLDCLHFLFEEDFTSLSEEHARAKSNMRTHLYKDMYGVPYNFKVKDAPKGNNAGGNVTDVQHTTDYDDLGKADPFNPSQNSKPFSPRTEGPEDAIKSKVKFVDASKIKVNEHFSSTLDAPLG